MTPTTNGLGAAGAGGAVAVILVWLINTFLPAVAVSDAVAQAFTILCMIGASYVIPSSAQEVQSSAGTPRRDNERL